jgi:TPP-dependent 2-oxoacid decarboxylase
MDEVQSIEQNEELKEQILSNIESTLTETAKTILLAGKQFKDVESNPVIKELIKSRRVAMKL